MASLNYHIIIHFSMHLPIITTKYLYVEIPHLQYPIITIDSSRPTCCPWWPDPTYSWCCWSHAVSSQDYLCPQSAHETNFWGAAPALLSRDQHQGSVLLFFYQKFKMEFTIFSSNGTPVRATVVSGAHDITSTNEPGCDQNLSFWLPKKKTRIKKSMIRFACQHKSAM